jgi:chromatin segregation and condensation protein Rec8/ScpA/Scc1 (kleisin family)
MKKIEEEPEVFGWGDIPQGYWIESDDGYSYTNLVMNTPTPPLEEPVRRDSKRKVTLIELLDAFGKAKKESEEYQLIEIQRREERIRLAEKSRRRIQGTAHEDHLEEDIQSIWDRIKQYPQKTMSILDICDTMDKDEIIKVFMSILFLASDNKITVFQRKFPYGKIYIKNP